MPGMFPDDGRTVLILSSGYHLYLDTGICTEKSENKFFIIDGATVRLIRFGSSLNLKHKTRLCNVTITVDSGELWYLNTSHEIDEFSGALTVVFNNGTYDRFVMDYSKNKIFPQGGKYFVSSPPKEGMKLIPEDTPGHFTVSGRLCAYCVSEDKASAYYSVCSHLRLPPGFSEIHYAKHFSVDLLPPPPPGKQWQEAGSGRMILADVTDISRVYVRANAGDMATGSREHPFSSVDQAVAFFGKNNGTVVICGRVPFSTHPQHEGVITFEGEDSRACLFFERNAHYYLQGDTVFTNIQLLMKYGSRDITTIVTNGHSLVYGSGVVSDSGVVTSTGGLHVGSKTIKVSEVYFVPTSGGKQVTQNSCILFARSGSLEISFHGKKTLLSPTSPVILPEGTDYTVSVSEKSGTLGQKAYPILAVEFFSTVVGTEVRQKSMQTAADFFFGDLVSAVFDSPDLLYDRDIRLQLACAIERISDMNSAKQSAAWQLHEYIKQNYATIASVAQLAEVFHLNRSHIERVYKKEFGVGLKKEITRRRCEAALTLLHKGYSISETAKMVGYDSVSSFSRAYRNETGSSPRQASHFVNH